MEVEEIQAQACKFPRLGNGRSDSNKVGPKLGHDHHYHHYPDDDDGDGGREIKRVGGGGGGGPVADSIGINGGGNRLRGWHHSSRIIRVSRASGGKDRHSKVWTSKGLRDRRVRLSVATAIQFYDLQDRLGCDQPSKAVEWLINAAADAIAELPSLNSSFPDTPKQPSDEKRASVGTEPGFDSAEVELDGDQGNYHQHQDQNQNQHLSLSKSACSSTSETSKGSGLSLSRSEIRVNRVKARERARERAAKEKEKENESRNITHHHHDHNHHHQNMNSISQSSTFTELLTAGISNVNNNTSSSPTASAPQNHPGSGGEPNLFHKAATANHMDYFATGLLGLSSAAARTHQSSGFAGQIHLGNSLPQSMSPFGIVSSDHGHAAETLQHFSFVPEHFIPVATASQPNGGGGGSNGGDYNLNFSISSGLAGFNRGTLQSNSPSLLPHLQRFSPIDGTNVPFFMAASAAPPMENHHHHHHHQFPTGFDSRLQLSYGDGSRHSDQKGKGKN